LRKLYKMEGILPEQLQELGTDLENLINKDEITALAIECGYEKRDSPLNGFNFFLIHLLGAMDKGMSSSLTELCNQGQLIGIHVAKESINDRYTHKASTFLKNLSQLILSKRLGQDVELDTLKQFNGIYVSDSTSVEIPPHLCKAFGAEVKGKSTSLLKLDCTFDLQSDWSGIWLRYGASSDQTLILGPPKQSLWLRDLGYYRTDDFKGIDYQGGKFISRARMDIPLYLSEKGTDAIDLVKMVGDLKENEVFEQQVRIGGQQRMPVRVVITRVTDKIAEKKREKLRAQKREKSRKISERRLLLCALTIYITNLDKQVWSAEKIHLLYKIRWQIELIFKVWKSHLGLEKIPQMNKHRFECTLYTMLIYITLNHKLVQRFKNYYWNEEGKELSEIKFAKTLEIHKHKLKELFMGLKSNAMKFIKDMYKSLSRLGMKQVRLKNRNPLFREYVKT